MKFEFFLHFLSVDCQFNCASQNVKQCQIAKFWPGLRMLQWQSTLRYRAAFIISGQSDKNKTNLQRKGFLRGVCSVASVLDLSTRALQNVESCNFGLKNKIWEHQALCRGLHRVWHFGFETSQFRDFCQFSEGFGFSFRKNCLKKSYRFGKLGPGKKSRFQIWSTFWSRHTAAQQGVWTALWPLFLTFQTTNNKALSSTSWKDLFSFILHSFTPPFCKLFVLVCKKWRLKSGQCFIVQSILILMIAYISFGSQIASYVPLFAFPTLWKLMSVA